MEKRQPRGRKPVGIKLTTPQKEKLEQITRSNQAPHGRVMRAKIILEASTGKRNQYIATDLNCHIDTVRTWRGRWAQRQEAMGEMETEMEVKEYQQIIVEMLADAPRSGAPGKFTPEQLCQIIAVACQPPEAVGCPVTHWTPKELANEVVKQEIVESISPRHIGRFLKGGRAKTTSKPILANQ